MTALASTVESPVLHLEDLARALGTIHRHADQPHVVRSHSAWAIRLLRDVAALHGEPLTPRRDYVTSEWTTKKLARSTREHLANLLSPVVVGTPHDQARRMVLAVIDSVVEHDQAELLRADNWTLHKELRDRKFSELQRLVAEHTGVWS